MIKVTRTLAYDWPKPKKLIRTRRRENTVKIRQNTRIIQFVHLLRIIEWLFVVNGYLGRERNIFVPF